MNARQFLLKREAQAEQLIRGKVLIVNEDGSALVKCNREQDGKVWCDILRTSEGPDLHLTSGDTVLVWLGEDNDRRGVVLGRIGRSHAPSPQLEKTSEELVIKAKNNLILQCGEGSITLRGDGKILIKGKDLVSRAQRMNRIRGGGVAIN